MFAKCSFVIQDGSDKSRSKSPQGAVASVIKFIRQLLDQTDGFMVCVGLLVAALAVSFTGICRERRKPPQVSSPPPPADAAPATKKKVT